jgi:NTP pyrophosphatase (non-canonical NTP hydrolase)
MKSLNDLARDIHRNAISKGFYEKPVECGTQLMLVVSELAEALEADRKDRRADLVAFNSKRQRTLQTGIDPFANKFESHIKDTFEDEIADAIIRLLDLSASQGIDIERHVELKMRYNALREYKHSKKY